MADVMFSVARRGNFTYICHFSHMRGGSEHGFSQKRSMPKGVRS